MKAQLARSTAGIALAVTAMSAAHANENAADVAAIFDPSVATVAVVQEGTHETENPALIISAVDQKRLDESIASIDVAALTGTAKVALSDDIQQAIYDVDFASDGEEGFVNTPVPSIAPSFAPFQSANAAPVIDPVSLGYGDTAAHSATFGLSQHAQQAVYNVNFSNDLSGSLVSTKLQLPGATETGVVTLRSLSPFYGDISPFYGDINPFWGDINPFWGDINPFYGDINPFYGDISPFYGDITAFWGDINPFYGDIVAFDANKFEAFGDFWNVHRSQIQAVNQSFDAIQLDAAGTIISNGASSQVMAAFGDLFNQAEAQFGAEYKTRTGNDFSNLIDEIFTRHGFNPNDAASLEAMTAAQRGALLLDWHDSINLFSGFDAVDHWMATINWTPELTQIQGRGADTIIGIIDGSFSNDSDLSNNIIWAGGFDNEVGGHGAGVASLIAGAHDGRGVMGIAPDVNIATYNPFNPEGGSGWDDVAEGILAMQPSNMQGANRFGRTSIINMSLGERGWVIPQAMADMFARTDIQSVNRDTLYVIASGNEGITQTTDIEWRYGQDSASTIFVGSVNPVGEISSFSNRPGSTCLLDNGVCNAGNELYLRTVVAPGEMLLLSDGQGGVTRHSGTSFAAPLVSGAVALLHDRWPWLAQNPESSAQIIFRSARDLGAPGPDEVYGWGLLDVTASQSPLDFNSTFFSMFQRNASTGQFAQSYISAPQLFAAGIPSHWETEDVFFTGFEFVAGTYRDFAIPASSFAYGSETDALGRGNQRFQDYVSQRFSNWIKSGGNDANGNGRKGFSELRSNGNELGDSWQLRIDAMAPRYDQQGNLQLVHGAATLTDAHGKMSFTVGHGQGAMALSGYQFGIQSDYDPITGGVNPLLGLASGETFAQAGYKIAPSTTVRVGFSQNRESWNDLSNSNPEQVLLQRQFGDRPAQALTFDIEQKVSDNINLGFQYTLLDEANAVLGQQTGGDTLLGNGAQTEAMTVSASFNLGSGLTLDMSATGARTATSRDQLFTSNGNVMSTAGQISATKHGVLSNRDTLRLSVAQPLQVERGELQFISEQVIDRQTGELGSVTQAFGIETKRRITAEAVYSMPVSTRSDFALFGRHVSAGDTSNQDGFVVGGNFNLNF
ncbi:MAG: S8 family serine peptidase [Erythrobacter sp.]|uniref:S8 family serine peptidase n=1 Tax=Erythrobacter sp. TaxID=1042 RepID=UPI003298E21C